MDQVETNLPMISSSYSVNLATFNNMQLSSKQLIERIAAFDDNTRNIYDTTMKLRYAYSSADGLKEKINTAESLMQGIQTRMEKLMGRIEAVEKLRLRQSLERGYRIRWLMMTGAFIGAALLWAFLHFR